MRNQVIAPFASNARLRRAGRTADTAWRRPTVKIALHGCRSAGALFIAARYPLLSAADEIAIGYAIRDSRDKLDLLRLQRRASARRLATIQNELTQARNRLITSNLRLVVSIGSPVYRKEETVT